jgi:hypothetical protein
MQQQSRQSCEFTVVETGHSTERFVVLFSCIFSQQTRMSSDLESTFWITFFVKQLTESSVLSFNLCCAVL